MAGLYACQPAARSRDDLARMLAGMEGRSVEFQTARPAEALRQTRRARATTSARGGVPPRPTRCTRHIVCFAKSAPRFHPLAVVSSLASPISSEGFCLLDPFAKILHWVARQRTAPALPHSTRSAPRRASVQCFANCDGGGYDRLRPVSCERQPPRIEQRTSAHASEASQPMMNCGHRPKRTAGGSCTAEKVQCNSIRQRIISVSGRLTTPH